MDIKIGERMMSIREIQIENMQQTSEYLRLRREGMRGIHQTRPEGDLGLDVPESIKSILKGPFE